MVTADEPQSKGSGVYGTVDPSYLTLTGRAEVGTNRRNVVRCERNPSSLAGTCAKRRFTC